MENEEKIIIAFVFKRNGEKVISYSKFYLTLSMELNWFTPEKAKDFTERSIKNGLLEKNDDDLLSAVFDVASIDIPLGFRPSKRLFEKDIEGEILDSILQNIIKETKKDNTEILKKIREIEKEKNVYTEVAALFLCKELNIRTENFIEDIEKRIFIY